MYSPAQWVPSNQTIPPKQSNHQYKHHILSKNNFIELKNEIMGVSSYYLDIKTGYLWEFNNRDSNSVFFRPNYNVAKHLVEMNKLTNINYNNQPQTFI